MNRVFYENVYTLAGNNDIPEHARWNQEFDVIDWRKLRVKLDIFIDFYCVTLWNMITEYFLWEGNSTGEFFIYRIYDILWE